MTRPTNMKFFDEKGVEVSLETFEAGSVVIARVTKPMTKEEFQSFCKGNQFIDEMFADRNLHLVFCPDYVEFKAWN